MIMSSKILFPYNYSYPLCHRTNKITNTDKILILYLIRSGFVNKEQEKSILLLSGFIAAVVLDKAHNLVRKGFPAGFAEMDMNVKGRAADVLHKVGFGGQRGSGCGGAGLAGFIVHRLSFQR